MVQTRLLHLWEALNASINVHRQNIFKHLPSEGYLYELSVCDVTRSNPNFHFSDSPIAIRFTNKTVFAELSEMGNRSRCRASSCGTTTNFWMSLSNATSATHFYFDNECAAGQSYLERVCSCEEGSTFNPTKYGGLKKIERMTLGELNDYLLKSKPQHGFSSFSCAPSNEENAFSYQVAVAQDLQDWDLPQCLQKIVGSTLNFQLSLSHFNFSAIHQSFAGGNEMPQSLSLELSRESR
ncbi:hypothetical protein Bca101_030769 [Brassica carinata]